jgi:hypothetical protein
VPSAVAEVEIRKPYAAIHAPFPFHQCLIPFARFML